MGSNPSSTRHVQEPTSASASGGNTVSSGVIRESSPEPEIDPALKEYHQKNMKKLKDTIKHVKNDKRKDSKGVYLSAYAERIVELAETYFSTGLDHDRFRLEIGRELTSSGAISILCDLSVDVYNIGFREENGEISENYTVLESSLSALTNFSDSDQADTPAICEHPEFLKRTAKYLTDIKDKEDEAEAELIDALLSIIHNVAMFESNVAKIRSFDYVKVLTPYLDHKKKSACLIAIAAMADIVNEEESEILHKGQNVLKFLQDVLQVAMRQSKRMHPWLSWPVWELTRVMRTIAKNDANKKALVDMKFLPLLEEIAKSDDEREKREAIGTLRTLSFDAEIRKKMTSVDSLGLIDIFVESRDSKDPITAKSSKGALWNMREELIKIDKYKDIDIVKQFAAHQAKEQERLESQSKKGHIMVSYQWSNQQLLIKVRDFLRSNGFKVWMDIDDMAGSTLEAMARAVEEAEVVLVCYSRKYKDSDNCRAEAEYAFEKRKPVVPLRMEQNYKADGWLGIIIGAKKFYDFSGKYTFDSRTDDLVKELRNKYSDYQEIVPQNAVEVYSQPMVLSSTTEVYSSIEPGSDVKSWTPTQVGLWLDKHGLERSKFGKLHGVEIAYLQFLLEKSPDYFNKAMIEQLKIKDLFTMAKFTFAVADTRL